MNPSAKLSSLIIFIFFAPLMCSSEIIYFEHLGEDLSFGLDVDLDNDESPELSISRGHFLIWEGYKISSIYLHDLGGSQVLVGSNQSAISNSTIISSIAPFGYDWVGGEDFQPLFSEETNNKWNGVFGLNGNAYIGIKFNGSEGAHYGWINVHQYENDLTAVFVTGWAYETTPNAGIVAGAIPEPSTLGLIGSSVISLIVFRNRRKIGRSSGWTLR